MGHHSFETQRGVTVEAFDELGEGIGSGALAAHTGIDLEMDGN
jgi:hypothetical protein